MINTAQLQRLDRPSVESKAARFAGAMCLVLWLLFGVSVKVFLGDWYGFGIGFIAAAFLSALTMWVLYVRPTARERLVVRASWRGSTLRIYDPIDKRHEILDFSKPHKAILISSKAERQFLLRLEQRDNREEPRIDIIGQLPMALPMQVMGEASSLFGFFGKAKAETGKSRPYRIKEAADRESLSHSLLHFVESHRGKRESEIRIKKNGDVICWQNDQFSLLTNGRHIAFSKGAALSLSFMARSTLTAEVRHGHTDVQTTEILLALYPEHELENALVFAIIAPPVVADELPASWNLPASVLERKFTLYDDSVNSFVFAQTLKKYIKLLAPNAAILDVLRH